MFSSQLYKPWIFTKSYKLQMEHIISEPPSTSFLILLYSFVNRIHMYTLTMHVKLRRGSLLCHGIISSESKGGFYWRMFPREVRFCLCPWAFSLDHSKLTGWRPNSRFWKIFPLLWNREKIAGTLQLSIRFIKLNDEVYTRKLFSELKNNCFGFLKAAKWP